MSTHTHANRKYRPYEFRASSSPSNFVKSLLLLAIKFSHQQQLIQSLFRVKRNTDSRRQSRFYVLDLIYLHLSRVRTNLEFMGGDRFSDKFCTCSMIVCRDTWIIAIERKLKQATAKTSRHSNVRMISTIAVWLKSFASKEYHPTQENHILHTSSKDKRYCSWWKKCKSKTHVHNSN